MKMPREDETHGPRLIAKAQFRIRLRSAQAREEHIAGMQATATDGLMANVAARFGHSKVAIVSAWTSHPTSPTDSLWRC
jgi:hypothetical protein